MQFVLTKVLLIIVFLFFVFHSNVDAQSRQFDPELQDSSINNLVLPEGYKTSKLGELGKVVKMGTGKTEMILIPGWGFGWDIYDSFMKSNLDNYTMYAITIPGFGETQAPPMPKAGTSYGEHQWNEGVIKGIVELINKENLNKPVIVANFLQGTQIAFWLAYEHPELISSIIIIGGMAKYYNAQNDYTLSQRIWYADNIMAPNWFKFVKVQTWHNGNFLADQYSKTPAKGKEIWEKSAKIPIPILVQYLCELIASDITVRFKDLKVPALVLIPSFNEEFLSLDENQYVKPYFQLSWQGATEANELIQVKYINNSHLFIMDDQSEILNKEILNFVKKQ